MKIGTGIKLVLIVLTLLVLWWVGTQWLREYRMIQRGQEVSQIRPGAWDTWLLITCIIDDTTCDKEIEAKPNYAACMDAHDQYIRDHADEDYIVVCKRQSDIRALL